MTIRLDTVLETVELPATITHLNTGLAEVERKNFTLFFNIIVEIFLVKIQERPLF